MTCDIRDRNLPCEAAAYQLVLCLLLILLVAHFLDPARPRIL